MRILLDSVGQGQAHPNQRRVDLRPRHGERSRPGIGGPPGRIRRRGARNREGECHFCTGRRRWPSTALPVAVYRYRGLGRSNFFRPMPGSSALDMTELAHLVQ